MMDNLSKIKQKILEKKLVIGTHIQTTDPVVSEILCSCGFDLIWIDSEHGPLDKKDINLHIMAIKGKGASPFIRVPDINPITVKAVLEMGPDAIIFPGVNTAEEAKLAVSSCRYPPKGIRGFGPIRANDYSTMDNNEYLEMSKKEPLVILQIEQIDGVNNLGEIIKVEGVDTIVVGPNDLSGSVDLLGQIRHPEVLKLLDKLADTCKEANFPFGVSLGWSGENIADWIKRGVSWICVDGDISYLVNGGKGTYRRTRELIEKLKG